MSGCKFSFQTLIYVADLNFYEGLNVVDVGGDLIAANDLTDKRVVCRLALQNCNAFVLLVTFLLWGDHNVNQKLADYYTAFFHGHHVAPSGLLIILCFDYFLSIDSNEADTFWSMI